MGNFIFGAVTATMLSYAYEKATGGAFTRHVMREQGCNRVWKIIVRDKSSRSAIERLKKDGDEGRSRLLDRVDTGAHYVKSVRDALAANAGVRAYVKERFGVTEAVAAARAIAAAPVEYCGVDLTVASKGTK